MPCCNLQDGPLQLLLQQQVLRLEVALLDLVDAQVALEAARDDLGCEAEGEGVREQVIGQRMVMIWARGEGSPGTL